MCVKSMGQHLKDALSHDRFLCNNLDCGATFSVITTIKTSVKRVIDPTGEEFDGSCPACGCSDELIIDPASHDVEEANYNNDAYRKTIY